MAKAVVYTLMAAVFVVLMVFSPSKQHLRDQRGKNLLLGHKFPATSFVTLVIEMERLADIHEPRNPINPMNLKNDSFLGDFVDAYEHFSEGKLNITLRLKILFPFLDTAPSDGVVSFKELRAWMVEQTLERLQYMTKK
ncbi:hypothetical protein CJ030_MR4G013716 [Morella rubra]|uniref:Uncharacterized protein n=1 Tax=Morella rubra TaxID=262757 RepID=A0A6A1WSE7_9ROSI|nr:hypothetical protein CJ030_MR4G013716 [Morella rubra]